MRSRITRPNNPHAKSKSVRHSTGSVRQLKQRQQKLLQRQHTHGNAHVARLVEYNATEQNGHKTDPESATGVLPFTASSWDGLEIGRNVSQLNLADRTGEHRCVEASFLIALIQRGPDALKGMIENYLRRYRGGIRRESTPENIKAWYRRSIARLAPMLGRIDDQTLSYQDLSTIQREMYAIYGEGTQGTQWQVGDNMAKREGYETEVLNQPMSERLDLIELAADLEPGQILNCRVKATRRGVQDYDHAIHVGRHPETEQLYLYDPAPIQGDQLVVCSESLTEINHYFDNPETVTNEDGTTDELVEARTFNVYSKLTPPAEEASE